MLPKVLSISVLSGFLMAGIIILYMSICKNVISGIAVLCGLILIIVVAQVATLLTAQKINIKLTYLYSLLILLISSLVSTFTILACLIYIAGFELIFALGAFFFLLLTIFISLFISAYFPLKATSAHTKRKPGAPTQ